MACSSHQRQIAGCSHVLLFAILAIVTGCNSHRGIVTFIDVHRHRLKRCLPSETATHASAHRDPLHHPRP